MNGRENIKRRKKRTLKKDVSCRMMRRMCVEHGLYVFTKRESHSVKESEWQGLNLFKGKGGGTKLKEKEKKEWKQERVTRETRETRKKKRMDGA